MKLLALWAVVCCLHAAPAPVSTETIVTINGMRFEPAVIEIEVGQTVRWVNPNRDAHNVVERNRTFASPMLQQGEEFIHTFTKAGEYRYFCKPHKLMGMKAVVVVQ